MPREQIKPRSISRTITPRNIRAIKPKRQLAWNKQHDEVDDDLWFTTVYGDSKKQGGGSSSSSSTSRPRQSYNNVEDDDYDSEEEENDNIPRSSKICKLLSIFKAIYKCLLCICKSIKGGYDNIRKLPPTQRRNRFLLFLILICVLRIYLRSMFMNLNQYSLFKNEKKSITPVVGGRSGSSMPLDTDDGWEESSSLFGTPKTQSKVMGAGGAASSSPLFGSSNLRGASSGLMSSGSMGSSLSSGIQQQPQTGGLNTNSLYPQQQASAGYTSGGLNAYGASGSIGSQLQSNAMQMGMKTSQYGGGLQQQPIQQAQMPQQNQYQQQAQMPQQNQLQYNNNPLSGHRQTQYKQPVMSNQYSSSSGSQQQSLNSGIVGNSQQSGGFGGGGDANMQNFF